ncbi:DNA-directed RNA polymerase I subunit RPA2 [Caerostris darwini]|uniref:DNA-directed RNA polymerase subunit beta n=1 Tax=Caerostris darwini TaxID=1538125 RepID=A0AAV4VIX6_9ARAC|nr:DNA-directed RNA polymerase I subunit RPA2 [Caerostris darwini]
MTESSKKSYLKEVSRIYLDSFNYVLQEGLEKAILDFDPVFTKTDVNVKISIDGVEWKEFTYAMDTRKHIRPVLPSEARERGATYYAELRIKLRFETDTKVEFYSKTFFVPLMVKSKLCFLNEMEDKELLEKREDLNDPGGYFIVDGSERLFRTFVVPRRNYPLGILNDKWKTLKKGYSEYGILISCQKDNHSISDVSLHYVNHTKDTNHVSVEVRIFYQGIAYFIPFMLLLKTLVNESDYSIIKEISKFRKDDESFTLCLMSMLRDLHSSDSPGLISICTQQQAKNYIGNFFHPIFLGETSASNCDVTDHILKSSVFIHLNNNEEKFQLFCFCICKLFALVKNECKNEELDNPVFQEILSPGQTYMFAIKDGLKIFLNSVRSRLSRAIVKDGLNDLRSLVKKCMSHSSSLTPIVKTIIATGNLSRNHGLMSQTGFTIPLKRTNVFEVSAQYSCIYKFSLKFYPTSMRKFYPESWGFLCPAQTPEGENSGLYNHLALGCQIVSLGSQTLQPSLLYKLGVLPFYDPLTYSCYEKTSVFLDGKIVGWIGLKCIPSFLDHLKFFRSTKKHVPEHTEIVYIPENNPQILFPGIFIFSTPCRLIRQVENVQTKNLEFLGCFEQLFTSVALFGEDVKKWNLEYTEVNSSNVLGMAASTIPFGENNPATRNIFSTGKSKQAVSFPFPNFKYRSDSKSLFLTYPQSPLVCTSVYADYNWDDNPIGTNIFIAVISYSGFDMEDAVVLNKAAVERGLMQDSIYKTVTYCLEDFAKELNCTVNELTFKRDLTNSSTSLYLDEDGLPYIGIFVKKGDPVLSVFNKKGDKSIIKTYNARSPAYIESAKLMGISASSVDKRLPTERHKIGITYRMMRIPETGDKFSNRHGQKGVCGSVISPENLPFTADGLIPDILFNPHGLPSRMSVGMLLEILASNVAAQKCKKIKVVPFEFSEKKNAVEEFGNILKEAGMDFYGTQKFYSGTSGELLEADVYSGYVYSYRLHHVVEDKYQVVSLAENYDPKTMQPLNLYKAGAIRFGEMEKDAILSHGAMSLTLDRLLLNSDKCNAFVCGECESLLFPVIQPLNQFELPEDIKAFIKAELESSPLRGLRRVNYSENKYCHLCQKDSTYGVRIPYALVYLVAELATFNIKVNFSVN